MKKEEVEKIERLARHLFFGVKREKGISYFQALAQTLAPQITIDEGEALKVICKHLCDCEPCNTCNYEGLDEHPCNIVSKLKKANPIKIEEKK